MHAPRSALVATLIVAGHLGVPVNALLAQGDSSAVAARDSARAQALMAVRVVGRADDLRGIAHTASEGRIGAADLRLRPRIREGELLESVPGLVVTQHSGDGKANQYFIRGFNLDHGTDFQTRVDGMPVNMPSHAHGQGYTDLNFIIPELVDRIDYRLGVYHPELGDFGSAGGAEFHLLSRLERPFTTLEAGEHGLGRAVLGASTPVGAGDLLFGGEVKRYDGPWILAQELRKVSGVARYSWDRGSSRFSLLGMAYQNAWNATDQVPLRAVTSGAIDRFGHVDGSDGGRAQRYSLSGSWRHLGGREIQELQLFGIYADLDLYSNFTYFLDDTARGDQFNQRERRVVLGGSAKHTQEVQFLQRAHTMTIGLENRTDLIAPVGLFRSRDRVRSGAVRQDEVTQTGTGVFAQADSRWRPWFRSTLGLRGDAFTFAVTSDRAENSGRRAAGILSPKGALIFVPSRNAELYLSGGLGFHSNDARGTTIRVDPVTGDPASRVDALVRSRGVEVGVRVNPVADWRSTLALWGLELDSELLFIGDGGSTEPSDRSRRTGITWANFYRPVPRLTLDADLSLARARFAGAPRGEEHIPGALERVVAGGVTWTARGEGSFAAVRLRHLGPYPLLEDNGVRANSTTLINAEAGFAIRSVRIRVAVLNARNERASDIQYYYTSRLAGEPAGVDDIHFHPVEPRQLRLSLGWGL